MKKTKIVVLICAMFCTFGLSSCGDPIVKGYGLGISEFHSSGTALTDLEKVTEYLNSKGCPTEGEEHVLTVVDYSLEKCDKAAAAKFNNMVKNLSRDEVAKLGLSESCTFTYSCRRQDNPSSEIIVVGAWSYPDK